MKLRGAWHRDYSEFFDTQEALLIDAMDNADSIYTVFARLQSLAVKCGCTHCRKAGTVFLVTAASISSV